MNYIIPEGFNFYEELNKTIQASKTTSPQRNNHEENKCLISGSELSENAITLECGHSFNYIPLFNDLVCYKYPKHQGHYIYSDNLYLKEHELRCPYCKQLIILNKFASNKMRHGVLKYKNELIHPGMSDTMALNLARLGIIYGCGKKYKIYRGK